MPVSAERRVGLLARATRSGLGYLSKSFAEHYRPHAIVCVTDCDRRYKDNIDWYPGAVFVRHADMRMFPFERFLSEIHTIFSYETFYHAKVLQTAKRMKVRSVLMGMPELTRIKGLDGWFGDADRTIWPTSWLLPPDGRVVPVPVDEELFGLHAYPHHDGPLRVLHVAGARAIGDRNGTEPFIAALKLIRSDVFVRICINDNFEPMLIGMPNNVEVEVVKGADERGSMYAGMHVLVLPRRYGGLSLVAQEAAAAGLALAMTDCAPNDEYPAHLMKAQLDGRQRVPIGKIDTYAVPPRVIAGHIDDLARDPDRLAADQKRAQQWAVEHTWAKLRNHYNDAFGILRQ